MLEKQKLMETVLMLTGYRQTENIRHGRRVGEYVRILLSEAESAYPEIRLTEEVKERIVLCAMLHDIGKNVLPDRVLSSGGRLTEKEYEYYRTHTLRGEEMAGMLSLVLDRETVECLKNVCRYHHERYDGRGYPDRLSGEEIPFEAQVAGLADAIDDMVSDRLYKYAYTFDDAYERIINGECGVFSLRLIGCFLRAREELMQAVKEYRELR